MTRQWLVLCRCRAVRASDIGLGAISRVYSLMSFFEMSRIPAQLRVSVHLRLLRICGLGRFLGPQDCTSQACPGIACLWFDVGANSCIHFDFRVLMRKV